MALECHCWGSPCAPVTLEDSPGRGSGRKRGRGGWRGSRLHRHSEAEAWSGAGGERRGLRWLTSSRGPGPSVQPLRAQPCGPGGRRCLGTAGSFPSTWRPGPPSAPAPPPALPSPPHPPGFAGIRICGPRWAASQWVLLRSLFFLTGCDSLSDSVGRCRHGERLEDSDFGQGGAPGLRGRGPGVGGVSPGPPRAGGLDQSKPRPASALQTRLSPVFPLPLLPGTLGSAHFILSSTYSPMKGPAGAGGPRNEREGENPHSPATR